MNNKIIKVILGVFIFAFILTPVIKGATSQDIIDYAKKSHVVAGKTISLSSQDIARVERFFNSNNITAEQGDAIIAKANEAIELMNNAGVSDYSKLNNADKQTFLKILNDAGSVVGVNVTYSSTNGSFKIFQNGKQIEEVSFSSKLPFTGTDITLFVSGLALIAAIIAIVIAKNKIVVNEKKFC